MAEKKKPRRTAERILEVTLQMFNRFGEPNVSTTAISAELNISPGNLYYHYPAKDELINALVDRYERALAELLGAAEQVRNVEDAWLFVHMLFELIWNYRFLYRDLNDLLSKNRRLETHFQAALHDKARAMQALLDGLVRGQALHGAPPQSAQGRAKPTEPTREASHEARLGATESAAVSQAMIVVLTYWLSYEYVRDPRHALEPESAAAALNRGAFHVLSLLLPYLETDARNHLLMLAGAYRAQGDRS
jgi:AcrR family transcriptional regulator